ncbi:MAG: cytochrome c biogenesis protein CcsA [Phycisphaerales bacterium]
MIRHLPVTSRVLVLLAILTLGLSAATAPAQGPAGNAHPEQEAIEPGAAVNPLDPHELSAPNTATVEEKVEFASEVNLAPLAGIPVMANSRVGVLDTVARDTVRRITGRRTYQDFIVDESGDRLKVEKINYDPIFTFFDLMADPAYYLDKPLIHVEFLSLRRGLLEAEFPSAEEDSTRERWMKLTRLAPTMVLGHPERIRVYLADNTYSRAINQVSQSLNYYLGAYTRLRVVPPAPGDDDWGLAASDAEVARLFGQLGEAWRARDAVRVNAVAREISRALEARPSRAYPPDWRRSLELMYNGTGKFILGYTLYFLSFVTLIIALGTGRVNLRRVGVAMLVGGVVIHAAGFVARWILAERIPIQNQFESMLGLCLGAVLCGTALMLARRQTIFGVAAAGVGFLTLMTATMSGVPGEEIQREAAILNTSYILFYHVNVVLFSYGLISLGAIISAFYLITHYFKGDTPAQLAAAGVVNADRLEAAETVQAGRQRLLNDLDHAQMVVLQLAFWILGVGILLGAWWADHSWGRWWAFDPKETWALITWIVYLVIVHVRLGVKRRGLVTAWLSILGFFIMLWTYFGVNLILPGLHAYA